MALTCGFFNSINKDRLYDAIQFGQIFDGIIADGVYATYLKGMVVIASDNPNEVIIQPGRAWFNHTWSYNDANLPFEAPEPEVLLDRIDTLVLDVNLEQAERNNTYIWVQGTPSSQNPQPPALIRSVTHNQYPLCDVYRKAGTTMIYTKDITNRIGTSDTPFATGVLEGIDLDMWINQWDNEFHTWEIDTKAEFDAWELNSKNSFETWMISQQQVYTAWFNSIKDQMSDDLAEFEAWFETIKDIIDESAALHLQAEIDEINKKLPSGSHITITTENTELFGRNVTVTDGTHPTTVKFDNSGVAEVETYPYVGNITITSTDGIRTATTTTHIPYFGRYSYGISFWAAVVNIIGDEEFANYPVTVKNSNGDILTTIILDSSAQGTWTAIEPDTYTFSVTYGGETMEVSLNVTQETTYTVEIHAQPTGFDFEEWLTAGDVSGTYADLDAVLADEVTVRKLMTKHASIDYLASFTDEDESVIKILNNDLCAKWISLRDYAMDVLEAAYGTLMGTIGKYGYGEWALQNAVPVMTSNTSPYGQAFAGNSYSGYYPFGAFLFTTEPNVGTGAGMWCSAEGTTKGAYVGYGFTEPVVVKRAVFKLYNTASVNKVVASNDLSTPIANWTAVSADVSISKESSDWFEASIECTGSTAYQYYALYFDGDNYTYGYVHCAHLKFYAYSAKGAVPIMTSNTAPYGEAIRSGASSSSEEAWRVFNNNLSQEWSAANNDYTIAYVGYKFTTPIKVLKIDYYKRILSSSYTGECVAKIQASNDNSLWTDLTEEITFNQLSTTTNEKLTWNVTKNVGYYLYYRLKFVRNINANCYPTAVGIQFYGRELKVSVPTMTGNTTPYGEVGASSTYSGRPAYQAFNGKTINVGDGTTFWLSSTAPAYVYYHFTQAVNVIKAKFATQTGSGSGNTQYKYMYSDDGTNWEDATDLTALNISTARKVYTLDFPSCGAHEYWAFYVTDRWSFGEIQFYGKDYSEYDWDVSHPRHYIYDHGVEFETLTNDGYTESGYTVIMPTKEPSQLYSPAFGSEKKETAAGFDTAIDMTPYSLARLCMGNKGTVRSSDNAFASLLVGTTKANASVTASTVANCKFVPTAAYPNQIGLSVSGVNQNVYACVWSGYNTRSFSITEWWLE